MGKSIVLYIDIVSPFAYMGYWLTRNSPAFKGIKFEYVPILLGGVMQQAGNVPPISIKNKSTWINIERERHGRNLGIPITKVVPQPFPQSTVNTQRALCYLYAKGDQAKLAKAIDALYKTFWIEAKTIGKPEVIAEGLKNGGFGDEEVKEILAGIKSDEAKKLLKDNSDRAFKDGCFGLPWFVATNDKGDVEKFWGVDHIGQLLDFLGVDLKGEARYKAML